MEKYSWLFEVVDPDKLERLELKDIGDILESVPEKKLEDEEIKELLKCALCPNMCEFACPVLEAEGRETVSPSRKSRLGYFYACGNLTAQELGENHLYCLNCDACERHCPMDFSVSDMLVPVREDLNRKGVVVEDIRKIEDNLKENGTIYKELEGENFEDFYDVDADSLYFRSCVGREETPRLVDSTARLMVGLDDKPLVLEDELCCGAPARILGFEDTFLDIAEMNVDMFNESDVERIVGSCPTCVYTLREIYPEYGFEIDPKVIHVAEYLDERMGDLDLRLSEEKSAIYHDPCTLARRLEVIEGPRKILSKVVNLELSEPFYNKEDTYCCGRGGPLKLVNEELAGEVGDRRYNQLKDSADTVITSCPSCKKALSDASDDLELLDLAEILNKSLQK